MSAIDLFEQTENLVAICVRFAWGSNEVYYCDQKNSIEVESITFLPAPELEARFTKPINGSVQAEEAEVKIHRTRSPINNASLPYAHAPITVSVWEADLNANQLHLWFKGKAGPLSPEKNKPGLMSLTAVSPLLKLKANIGIQCVSRCRNPFGNRHDSPCGVPLSDKTHEATITAIGVDDNPCKITVDFGGGTPSPDFMLYWSNGEINIDGRAVKIRSTLDGLTFVLKRPLHPSLVGADCLMIAGCNRTFPNCEFWQNKHRFMGKGLLMPDYHPNYEIE